MTTLLNNYLTPERINEVYAALKLRKDVLHKLELEMLEDTIEVDKAWAREIAMGLKPGKNDDERDAQRRAADPQRMANLDTLKEDIKSARYEMEIAKLDVEWVQTVLNYFDTLYKEEDGRTV